MQSGQTYQQSVAGAGTGYDEKNYDAGKEGVVDPSREAYGYTEPIGEDVEERQEETKRELKPR